MYIEVTCSNCNNVSTAFENFLSLHLDLLKAQNLLPCCSSETISISDCLKSLCGPEELYGSNKFFCPKCKDHQTSMKKLLFYKHPKILIVHLKRFTKEYGSAKKLVMPIFVDGNLKLNALNISHPNSPIYNYRLYAIVNHYGNLEGGHYTADCHSLKDDNWYNFNDSTVNKTKSNENLTLNGAYILFYSREK